MRHRFLSIALAALAAFAPAAGAEVGEVRITKQFGLGFLPLMVMENNKLMEKHLAAAGLGGSKATYSTLSNPAAVNDALLAGQVDFIPNGPPATLTMWARTKGTASEVRSVCAMIQLPMWLNVRNPSIKSVRDLTENDRIVVTAIKVSIPAIILQMVAAREWGKANYARFDPLTIAMGHPDGMTAFLSGKEITAHFTSPPFMYQELERPGVHTILSSDDVMGGPTTFSGIMATAKFRNENPKSYAAFLAAFSEAIELINKDKRAAAEIYLKVTGDKKSTVAEIQKQIEDPQLVYTTTPRNFMKYADFMYDIGSIKQKAGSWKDIFFPEVHHLPGS
jgi:NitT/TauT family transport system substrate-binding protein